MVNDNILPYRQLGHKSIIDFKVRFYPSEINKERSPLSLQYSLSLR
jgi:hypothetical protein